MTTSISLTGIRFRGRGPLDSFSLENLGAKLFGDFGIVLQVLAGGLAALAQVFPVHRVPCAALLDDLLGHGEIEDVAFSGDALAEQDIEFGLPEGWAHFVLDDLGPHTVAHVLFALLDARDAAHVDAQTGVEL